jgi:hypothetical protein
VLLVNAAAVAAVGTPALQFAAVFQTPVVAVVFQLVCACKGIASTSPMLNAASNLIVAQPKTISRRLIRSAGGLEALSEL